MSEAVQNDSFVNVWFTEGADHPHQSFYKNWHTLAAAKHSSPDTYAADALAKMYPKHSLVMSSDYGLDVFGLPGVTYKPLDDIPLITDTLFISLSRMQQPIPGTLIDMVKFGGFDLTWDGNDFLVYILWYPEGFGVRKVTYILHKGSEDPARSFILASGLWYNELHNEIWVFNQGFWSKDAATWAEIQKADWNDIILKEDFKKNVQKDVFGFFTSEELYKKLAIPWKRGLIMHGPPGNGKTITLKAIMKTCGKKGYSPLYVKSFQSWKGEEGAMLDVFSKARQLAPCVLILEDLDSLINDRNRSFFLNQVDGLNGNDGLLLIGTTNHFDRLDPGLSTRPSRFDRKYLFDDPDLEERTLYALYWQNKLKDNKKITFPDSLVKEVAESTSSFSFAYLKEAFVSSLVILAGYEDKNVPEFRNVLKDQIKVLRKQLDKPSLMNKVSSQAGNDVTPAPRGDVRTFLDSLAARVANSGDKVLTTLDISRNQAAPGEHKNYRDTLERISSRDSNPGMPGWL